MPDHHERAARLIKEWYQAALVAVEPEAAVRRHLACDGRALVIGDRRARVRGRLVLLAIGKAAVAMTRGGEAVCGDLIGEGLVITKDGHTTGPPLASSRVREAAHPIPDERGVRATREALELVQGLRREDVLLALISGGGRTTVTTSPGVILKAARRTTPSTRTWPASISCWT